jgi:hypothetical protein
LLFGANVSLRPRALEEQAREGPSVGVAPGVFSEAAPKWKRFEQLASDIQRGLLQANATVTTNERIRGRITEVMREADIAIRVPLGEESLLMVVDCKDLIPCTIGPAAQYRGAAAGSVV